MIRLFDSREVLRFNFDVAPFLDVYAKVVFRNLNGKLLVLACQLTSYGTSSVWWRDRFTAQSLRLCIFTLGGNSPLEKLSQ